MDLAAVNYLHWGKPKVWYVVAGEDGKKMQKRIEEALSDHTKLCANIMRHKDYIVTREFLQLNKINYKVLQQYAGEFIVTFPCAFHQGFNLGINFAEATNFATAHWLKFGQEAVQCSCGRIEPVFDMDIFSD